MGIRITDVEVMELRVPGLDDLAYAGTNWTCLVRVRTDGGVTGTSEVTSVPAVIKAIIETPTVLTRARGLRDLLVGSDPTDVDGLQRRMYELTYWHGRRGVVIHAIGAIEIALWDIVGQLQGVPIAQLLGRPQRQRVRAYATLYPTGSTVDEIRRRLDPALAAGFNMFKICADRSWALDPDQANTLIRTAREHVGADRGLILEACWAFHSADELLPLIPVLKDCSFEWLEAPLLLDDLKGHAQLHRTGIPVAAGDNALTSHYEFEQLMDQGEVDIAQPDIAIVGGFREAQRVAEAARCRKRRVVVHGYKTSITDAINLTFASQHWADEPIEFAWSESPLRTGLLGNRLELGSDGRLPVPDGLGLGIELDEASIQRYRVN